MAPKKLDELVINDDTDRELEQAIHWALVSSFLGYSTAKSVYNFFGFDKKYGIPAEKIIPKYVH